MLKILLIKIKTSDISGVFSSTALTKIQFSAIIYLINSFTIIPVTVRRTIWI